MVLCRCCCFFKFIVASVVSILAITIACKERLRRRRSSSLNLINRALARTLAEFEGNSSGFPRSIIPPRNFSIITELCQHLRGTVDYDRIGCCSQNYVRHLYNVKIEDGCLVAFVPSLKNAEPWVLPPLQYLNDKHTATRSSNDNKIIQPFSVPITYREGGLSPLRDCKEFFNGTLHIVGRKNVHNTYHALADNVFPLMSQMLMDYYLAPELLYSPRLLLTLGEDDPLQLVAGKSVAPALTKSSVIAASSHKFSPSAFTRRQSSLSSSHRRDHSISPDIPSEAIHLRLMEDFMSEGALSLSQASGWCFRRVIWGNGPHVLYTAMLQRLRRIVARFAKEFATDFIISQQKHFTSPIVTDPWINSLSFSSLSNDNFNLTSSEKNTTALFNEKNQPMKVIIYSNDNTNSYSSLANESLIASALQARGAQVVICCDRKTSIYQQLYNAINADIMIGLHGAALVHGVFMAPGSITIELKTLYAYESLLFPLISDAHSGIHAQIDARDYAFVRNTHSKRKYNTFGHQEHFPVDIALCTRILTALTQAMHHRHIFLTKQSTKLAAVIFLPTPTLFTHQFLNNLTVLSPIQNIPISIPRAINNMATQFNHSRLISKRLMKEEAIDDANYLPTINQVLTWVRRPHHRIGDILLLPLAYADAKTQHILGPKQKNHTYLCLQSPFQQWRSALMDHQLPPNSAKNDANGIYPMDINADNRNLRAKSIPISSTSTLVPHKSFLKASLYQSSTPPQAQKIKSISAVQMYQRQQQSLHKKTSTINLVSEENLSFPKEVMNDGGAHCRIRF